jgi:hypothetical protein
MHYFTPKSAILAGKRGQLGERTIFPLDNPLAQEYFFIAILFSPSVAK